MLKWIPSGRFRTSLHLAFDSTLKLQQLITICNRINGARQAEIQQKRTGKY